MQFNADLHIHGRFSAATSADMNFKNLARGSEQKGVDLVATGDCLQPTWLKEIKAMEKVAEGTFQQGNTRFVLTTEVEAEKRVHHLLMFPSISSVEDFIERIGKDTKNLASDGRPKIWLNGEELAQKVVDSGAYFGPAHAFTPWTGFYAKYDSLKHGYGDLASKISYLELGLSANTDYGDQIAELENITFLTNSDAHSPQPVRLAREFNVVEAEDMTFAELMMAIRRQKGRKFVKNYGLPEGEGKYNRTACSRCFVQYELNRALALRWKCICGGSIKKGVRERAEELGGGRGIIHPDHRPEYFYLIPLSEIIMRAVGHSSPFTGKVQGTWEALVKGFDNELEVLMDAPTSKIRKIAGDMVADAVQAFRDDEIQIIPGGGGKYGSIVLPGQEADVPSVPKAKKGQKSLFEYD